MSGDPNQPVIQLRDVYKAFGPKKVLNGVNLDVGQRESVVIIGGSGTGKSVTLKCILGLLTPDSGSIKVDGEEVTTMSGRDRDRVNGKFGMLFQGAALFDSLRVWENVGFGLMQGHGMGRTEARAKAIEKMAQVGLGPDVADRLPAELSGGMQKRVAFARAIAAKPEVVVLDDPTAGLDPIVTSAISKLIDRIIRDSHTTALTITQDLTVIRLIANRVAMLQGVAI